MPKTPDLAFDQTRGRPPRLGYASESGRSRRPSPPMSRRRLEGMRFLSRRRLPHSVRDGRPRQLSSKANEKPLTWRQSAKSGAVVQAWGRRPSWIAQCLEERFPPEKVPSRLQINIGNVAAPANLMHPHIWRYRRQLPRPCSPSSSLLRQAFRNSRRWGGNQSAALDGRLAAAARPAARRTAANPCDS
jgi:hypothetical protein